MTCLARNRLEWISPAAGDARALTAIDLSHNQLLSLPFELALKLGTDRPLALQVCVCVRERERE